MSSLSQPSNFYPPPIFMHPVPTSNGSFGPVFAVLAVIAVLVAVACTIGRLCTRRLYREKTMMGRTHTAEDLEDGFEINIIPYTKPAGKPVAIAKPSGKPVVKGKAKPTGGKPHTAAKHATIAGSRKDEFHLQMMRAKPNPYRDLKW